MAKIIGSTTATPNPRPDWAQTDETKADYIKNKPDNFVYCGDGEIINSDLNFSVGNAGKFLMVSDNGSITISPVSVGAPIVITTAEAMDSVLANATNNDVGTFYLYKGETTDKYENGALYGIEAE